MVVPTGIATATDGSRLLRQRMWVAALALGTIFVAGTVGLWTLGRAEHETWTLGECAYFVGDISHNFVVELARIGRVST